MILFTMENGEEIVEGSITWPLFATVDLSATLSMLQAEDEQHVAALR